jgi:hypothetical protein
MKRYIVFILLIILSSNYIRAQVDSVVIIHYGIVDYPYTGFSQQVDSFSAGIHVSQYKEENSIGPVSKSFYNWSGNLLLDSMTYQYIGSAWKYTQQTINQFDANDSLLFSNKYYFIDSSGVIIDTNIQRSTYIRDTIANTLQIIEEQGHDNVWSIISTIVDSFDTSNRLSYKLFASPAKNYEYHYHYLLNDSINYYLYKYSYGSSGDTDSVVISYFPSGYRDSTTTFKYNTFNGWTPNWLITYT